jgi:hypothetical protein
VRRTIDREESDEIDEASTEIVDSATQYCLLECSLIE